MHPVKVALAFAGLTGALVVGREHRHGLSHGRFHDKRADDTAVDVVTVCNLEGKILTEEECDQMIENGLIKYADGSSVIASSAAPATTILSVSSATPVASQTASAQFLEDAPASAATTEVASSPAPATSAAPSTFSSVASAAPSSAAQTPTSASSQSATSASGLNADFPSDIACSSFPEAYGAVPVDWMDLGGWIGIQQPDQVSSAGFDDIETMVSDLCDDGNCCVEGAYCSYACPPGYQKSQWPTTQGATGQSVGGIQCEDGVLKLTNPDYKTLCIPGTDKVNITVVNNLPGNASICRTDYPGTEAMVIPLGTTSGNTYPLTVPDESTYYDWEGKSTSAQYYVNKLDVTPGDGCIWGDGSSPIGNWAPANIGAGYSDGMAWLSIFQNAPTTYEKLDYAIEIVGDDLSGRCKYSNGQYCSGDNYDDCNTNDGCTVAVSSGSASFVLSSS